MPTNELQTVVVGYDGETEAGRALIRAADVAERFQARLVVVAAGEFASPPPITEPALDPVGVYPLPAGQTTLPAPMQSPRIPVHDAPTDHELLEHALGRARRTLAERELEVEYVAEIGDPATVVVDAATARAADLIVVAGRAHGFLERLLGLGVDSKIAESAPCDVLIVR